MIHHFIPWSEAILPPRQTLVELPGRFGLLHQLPRPEIIWIDETPSTHLLLKEKTYKDLRAYTMVCARRQTAGRGQRGNSWESEDYKNLTFSMPLYPDWIKPAEQFVISESFALSIVALLQEEGIMAKVKWPNDIYVGEDKICGILIEHALEGGEIKRSILSAGLNVNQLKFTSDAPNPASMLGVLRRGLPEIKEFDLNRLAIRLLQIIRQIVEGTRSAEGREAIHSKYMTYLFRNDGSPHRYRDNKAGQVFSGIIKDVYADGRLLMKIIEVEHSDSPSGKLRRDAVELKSGIDKLYYFKEVSHLPDDKLSVGYAAGI